MIISKLFHPKNCPFCKEILYYRKSSANKNYIRAICKHNNFTFQADDNTAFISQGSFCIQIEKHRILFYPNDDIDPITIKLLLIIMIILNLYIN